MEAELAVSAYKYLLPFLKLIAGFAKDKLIGEYPSNIILDQNPIVGRSMKFVRNVSFFFSF